MKKIIFTLLALVGTMSMNAQKVQVMKIMKNGEVIAKYKAAEADEVVFVEEIETTGTAEATIGGVKTNVNWVQLWKDGPKFAEYNVGATSATEYGGYYNWGKTTNKDTSGAYKDGTDALTGNDDTATNLWGSNWRMPTKEELDALLNNQNCTCTWTTQNGVNGLLCTGKGDYKDNSVFLPAAGNFCIGNVGGQSYYGSYWSSTPNSSDNAYYLHYVSYSKSVGNDGRANGFSVRPVLVEE